MSAMPPGKPGALTGAAAPVRRQRGAAGRDQTVGVSSQGRRVWGRPGARAARHLRAVPDLDQRRGTRIAPDAAGVAGPQASPGPQARPGPEARPAPRVPGNGGVPGPRSEPNAARVPRPRVAPDTARVPVPRAAPETGRAPGEQVRRHGAPGVGARTAPRSNTVRLTRRGRIVVAILLAILGLLLVALAWMVAAGRAQAAEHGLPQGAVYRNLTSVVVHPGQTLWSIASQAEPNADPRLVMQLITELNALHGTSIEPGQHLWVPHG